MEKEKLEQELKNLKNKYSMLIGQIKNVKNELVSLNNQSLVLEGAIKQTEKLLALYNNNTEEDSVKKEKEEK